MTEKLEIKVDIITHEQLAKSGIRVNCLGFVIQHYEEKYGKCNVWVTNEGICIATKVKPNQEKQKPMDYSI